MYLRLFLVFTAILGLLSGCAAPSISPEERAVLEGPARTLEARGAWREAATAWLQSAQTAKGDLPVELQLNAADALLEAGDGLGATQIVRALPQSVPPALSIRRALVLADASIMAGDPLDALQHLGPGLTQTNPAVLERYWRIRADALELTGDALSASRERSLRDAVLGFTPERYRNRQHIWDLLAQVPLQELEAPSPAPASAHTGWVELAVIARRHALDVDQLDAAIREWSVRNPGHPAGEEIVPEIVELARTEAQPPGKVALLLPQTGPFAAVAAAIRDGFMAAWYADAPNQYRPEIVLVDSHAHGAATAYSNSVNDGAQFVVGPLAKESVSEVIADTSLSVTTLALNYPSTDPLSASPVADGGVQSSPDTAQDSVQNAELTASAPLGHANDALAGTGTTTQDAPPQDAEAMALTRKRDLQRMYYFVLSPEDEARQAAEFAYRHGARQSAVLHATGAWGERVSDAFVQRWRDLGGVLAARTPFPEDPQGLSEAVEQSLNIERSKARAKQLRAVLVRDIKHEPQPRSDIDVIFMAAFPQAARQLRPQLLFHRAAHLPVLATSHVYAGVADPQADQDLNGVIFAEMPWLLTPDTHSLPAQARSVWPDSAGALGRLYAFGADAYTLIARLRELRVNENASYQGMTGKLSLDEQRHIRRDMQWSHFVEGVAQPFDMAQRLSTWTLSEQ